MLHQLAEKNKTKALEWLSQCNLFLQFFYCETTGSIITYCGDYDIRFCTEEINNVKI